MAEDQPPGGGRLFKKALAEAQKAEKQRRASRSRSGVPYPPLLSTTLHQAIGLRAPRRQAVLNARRRQEVGRANAPSAGGETSNDTKNRADATSTAKHTAVGAAKKEPAGDYGETGVAAAGHHGATKKDPAGDYAETGAAAAGHRGATKKDPAGDYGDTGAVVAGHRGATKKDPAGDYGDTRVAAAGHRGATKKDPAGDYGDTGAAAAGHRATPADALDASEEERNAAKNMACVDEFMQSLSKELGLPLARTPPRSSPPPPPPPIELRQATPPPPAFPPPPLVRILTVRNQQDAQAAFQAWVTRGLDALLVHVPVDIMLIDLEMIWEVLQEASLSIFQDPESIVDRLWFGR